MDTVGHGARTSEIVVWEGREGCWEVVCLRAYDDNECESHARGARVLEYI